MTSFCKYVSNPFKINPIRDVTSLIFYFFNNRVNSQKLLPLRWLSPEALSLGKFTVHSDMFAFGVTMWEMFTYGMQPYYGYSNEEVSVIFIQSFNIFFDKAIVDFGANCLFSRKCRKLFPGLKRGFHSRKREICADLESWNFSIFIYCTFSDQDRVEFDNFWRHRVSFCKRALKNGEWKPQMVKISGLLSKYFFKMSISDVCKYIIKNKELIRFMRLIKGEIFVSFRSHFKHKIDIMY